MTSRQKSFFDQDNSRKSHGNLHRQAGYAERKPSAAHNEKSCKPAIAPSIQTMSKLKAFQFVDGRPDGANKENEMATEMATRGQKEEGNKVVDANSLAHPRLNPPSTPATRLPLADLIGNIDNQSNRAPVLITSPDEQLVWQAGHSPLSSAKPVWKSRKRARSSSPVSSQGDACNSTKKEIFDMQKLGQNLKTPQADPAAELWSRYAEISGAKATPSGKKGPAFAHLINESSPHSCESIGSVGGLRRWVSCGVEWPASKPKRRRVAGSFRGDIGNCDGKESAIEQPGKARKSKTGLLIERIQETLGKQPQSDSNPQCPSSSSPLPGLRTSHLDLSSPLQRITVDVAAMGSQGALQEHSQSRTTYILNSSPKSSSTEYGDVELDEEDLDEIVNIANDNVRGSIVRPRDSSAKLPKLIETLKTIQKSQSACGINEDVDEFGDGEDLFAADMEQLASMYDADPVTKAKDTIQAIGCDKERVIVDESEDEFGDGIDEEQIAAAELLATQALQNGVPNESLSRNHDNVVQRFMINAVESGTYGDAGGRQFNEKILTVEEERSKLIRTVYLREAWVEMDCQPGSHLNVIGDFNDLGHCVIDNSHNMVILHPDILISAVVVATSFACTRRAVLEDRIKATNEASEASMYGKLLHELFQEALKANQWDPKRLLAMVETILPKYFEAIVELNLSLPHILQNIESKLPEMQAWAEVFVRALPTPDARVKDRNGKTIFMAVNKLLDVEEHIWSPMYGLKGNIDATVQVTMHDDKGERTLTVPFEIKTGRSHHSHIAQTALYTLLLSDRYDIDATYGILYYLNNSETSRVWAVRNDLIHIIIQRNKLACTIRGRFTLPPILKKSHQCGKCFAQKSCFLYHKLSEKGAGEDISAKEKFDDLVKHLNFADQEFFLKWDRLLTQEESENTKFKNELWTMTSKERERVGRCFSDVIIEAGSFSEVATGAKISRFQYTFIKKRPKPGFSFNDSQITTGEPIVISDERGHFALAKGFVTKVRKQRITVAVDRQLHNARLRRSGFDPVTRQVFTGIMEVTKEECQEFSQAIPEEELVLYRLDKDEFSNGMALVRGNLMQIMDDSVFNAAQIRSLIIHSTAPRFKPTSSAYNIPSTQMSVNSDQKSAVEKVMAAQDYALVLGMPGTGKTTTIAHIIRALVVKGKSVLLTSYQHSAVDNILLKLRKDDISILRLGAAAKVHPEVDEFAILESQPKNSIEDVRRSWLEPLVVATTCLGINHPLFGQRVFDYCIVDEASQITLPVCLGPIRMAKVFVLVGDHFQLPPLVQNEEAVAGGLNISLFKMLSEQHEEAVVSLAHQYRMCSDIMEISNRLIYSGRLVCGTAEVAKRHLHIPNPHAWQAFHFPPDYVPMLSPTKLMPPKAHICPGNLVTCFLARVLDPGTKVIFLNTDRLFPYAQDSVNGPRITNNLEATTVVLLTTMLLSSGIAPSDLGIITFYRSQLALLRQRMRNLQDANAVEMSTADRYQGRDKEAIIVSLVRSNNDGQVGDLLKDWRRINVAVTRAQSKLIIIGSKSTMTAGGDVLAGLVDLCDEKGWILTLPKDSLEGHMFDDGTGTQLTSSPFKSSPAKKSTQKTNPQKRIPLQENPNLALCLSPLEKKGSAFKVPEKRGRIGKHSREKTAARDNVRDVF